MVVTNKNDYYSDLDNSIIGIDEVGRGALCGPVVSCALILHKNISQEKLFDKITDSKKLSEKKRLSPFVWDYLITQMKWSSTITLLEHMNLRANFHILFFMS